MPKETAMKPQGSPKCKSGYHFGGPDPPNLIPKREKFDVKNQHVFRIEFFMVWGWFWGNFFRFLVVKMISKSLKQFIGKRHETLPMATKSRVCASEIYKQILKKQEKS